jgi:hypothetical protein
MADGSSRQVDRPPIRINRRLALKTLLGGIGLGVLGGILQKPPELQNTYQSEAAKEMDDPSKLVTLRVKQSQDYGQKSDGPNIRTEPRITDKNEPPNNDGTVPAGTVLTGVILERESRNRQKSKWLAYKNKDGKVRFVSADYLENPQTQSQ